MFNSFRVGFRQNTDSHLRKYYSRLKVGFAKYREIYRVTQKKVYLFCKFQGQILHQKCDFDHIDNTLAFFKLVSYPQLLISMSQLFYEFIHEPPFDLSHFPLCSPPILTGP